MQNVSSERIRKRKYSFEQVYARGLVYTTAKISLQHHPISTSGFITQPDRENNVEQPGRVCKTERSVLVLYQQPIIYRANGSSWATRRFFLSRHHGRSSWLVISWPISRSQTPTSIKSTRNIPQRLLSRTAGNSWCAAVNLRRERVTGRRNASSSLSFRASSKPKRGMTPLRTQPS